MAYVHTTRITHIDWAMTEDHEQRTRGILSPADREYLRGEKNLSSGAERNTRQRIRERVQEGLADFHLLWNLLPDRDLEQIFYPEDRDRRQDIRSSSHQAFAFLLLGLWTNRDPHPGRLEDAVKQAAYANNWLADTNFEITTEEAPSGDVLLAKLKHKEQRIADLKARIQGEELSGSKEAELKEEVRKEANFEYLLFEKGLADPTVDAEAFASISILGEESDLTPEHIETSQESWEDTPLARKTLPIVVDRSVETEVDLE